MKILQVDDLTVQFETRAGVARAVDGISFEIGSGETLAIVGESGSGKTVTALALMRLLPRAGVRTKARRLLLCGRELGALSEREMQDVRGDEIAMIFQEPMTSLNPLMSIGVQIEESIRLHRSISAAARRRKAIELLDFVRIADPHLRVDDCPHRLSGGMRQRVMIAMALACEPKLLVADEPTTALDVTVQAQILELLVNLQEMLGMSMLLITHDLGVVSKAADRVVVMYAGRAAESGAVNDVLSRPLHPYTRGLIGSLPTPRVHGQPRRRLVEIRGTVPPLHALPQGCSFAGRCEKTSDICLSKRPEITETAAGRSSACHFSALETV